MMRKSAPWFSHQQIKRDQNIKDDPEPIKFRLTDPRGRRTGFDPGTGENFQEDRGAFFSEFTSFVDPLRLFPEAPPFRYIAAKNPEPGVYGLEVFRIGDGPFKLTLGTVQLDQPEDAATVTGNIVSGETKRYEIVRAANGSVTIEPVSAFLARTRRSAPMEQWSRSSPMRTTFPVTSTPRPTCSCATGPQARPLSSAERRRVGTSCFRVLLRRSPRTDASSPSRRPTPTS